MHRQSIRYTRLEVAAAHSSIHLPNGWSRVRVPSRGFDSMRHRSLVPFVVLTALAAAFFVSCGAQALRTVGSAPARFPLIFEENRGQGSPEAAFVAAGSAGSLRLNA